MRSLPLFPLNTVLFPGMPLRLHIFEPRYLEMINLCIDRKQPFGVVLIREGIEALGGLAEPYMIGTIAQIAEVKPVSIDRMNILAIGGKRFRIHSLQRDKPYLVGEIFDFPIVKDNEILSKELAKDLLPWIETYLDLLSELRETQFDLSMVPKTPLLTAYLASVLLQVPLLEKQQLLSFEKMSDMFNDLHRIYRREVALLRNLLDNHIKRADEFLFPLN
ncbi:MAG: LON peptidase substrate-binding domain-containing protein [Anaerolineales bacterium]|nr:LON peptidase substrate-binding domain-containing protein [Anaerolineales bacterium]